MWAPRHHPPIRPLLEGGLTTSSDQQQAGVLQMRGAVHEAGVMFRLGLGLALGCFLAEIIHSHESPLISLDTLGPEKMYVILVHDMSSTDSRFLSPCIRVMRSFPAATAWPPPCNRACRPNLERFGVGVWVGSD